MFFIVGGVILLLDTALIAGIPLLLVAAKRPKTGLACAVVIGVLVVIDGTFNFDSVSYPKAYPFRLIGLPASVLPLSLLIIFASIAICGWAVNRAD
jgi:hypothetical protein